MRPVEFMHESRDCAVVALSRVCDVEYKIAHAALKKQGRRDQQGTYVHQTLAALAELGFAARAVPCSEFLKKYPGAHSKLKNVTTHHPHRFNKIWKDGRAYLFRVRRHIAAVVDGELCDWSQHRSLRVFQIFRVVKK